MAQRWWIAIVMAALLALTATACDEPGQEGPADGTTADATQTDTQGVDTAGGEDTNPGGTDTRTGLDIPDPDTAGTDTSGTDTNPGADTNPPDAIGLNDVQTDGGGSDTSQPDTLEVTSITPSSGPSTGETVSEIKGLGFTEDIEIYFGPAKSPAVNFVTARKLEVVVPSGTAGTVDVKAIIEGATATLPDGYTYVDPITIQRIEPDRSPTRGGVPFSLFGEGFTEGIVVSIGGRSAIDVQLVSETELVGVTPPGTLGTADVRVTSSVGTALAADLLTYYEPTRIDSLFPAAGPTTGNTEVVIEGAGFTGQLSVTFGNKAASIVSSTESTLTVRTPAQPAGARDVVVQSDDGSAYLPGGFTYYAPQNNLAVYDITPAEGPLSGGTAAIISGQNLDAANLSVTVGGAAATVSETSPDSLRILVPSGSAAGPADVVVSNARGTGTLTGGYTYLSDFQIDAINPATGPVEGGTTVLISGAGFTGTPTVFFGPLAAASVVVNSATELEVVTPAGSGGAVDVTVRLASGRQAVAVDGFFYTDALAVFALVPNRGSQSGNTEVTVAGKGFAPGAEVLVDGVAGTNVQVLDASTLSFRTPPHAPGIVEVVVNQGSESATSPMGFTYYDPGSFAGGGWGNPIEGTVNISVYAYGGGGPVEGAFVMLSTDTGTPYQGVTDVNGQITFSGEGVFGTQTVSASAVDHTSATITTIDAENITIYLQYLEAPPGDPPPGRQPGTISGNITGASKIGLDSDANLVPFSIVTTTQVHPFQPNREEPAQLVGDGFYSMTSRLGDVAVVGFCGVLNTSTGEFEPRFMAIRRFIFVAEGSSHTVDLDCTIPLSLSPTFKFINSPLGQGPTHNIVLPYLNVGPEGYVGGIWLQASTQETVVAENLAPLTGPLAGMSYYMLLGAFNYASGDLGLPYSIQHQEAMTDFSVPFEVKPMISIPQLITPTSGGLVQNGHFEWTMTSPAQDIDFYNVQLLEPSFPAPTPIWEIFLPGGDTSFDIPTFLPSSGAAEAYSGFAILSFDIIKTKGPFTYDKFTLNDLGLDRRLSWVTAEEFVVLP